MLGFLSQSEKRCIMNEAVTVWTLLFGDQPRRRECIVITGNGNLIQLIAPPVCRPRAVIGGPDSDVSIEMSIPHSKLLEQCNILLFDGLVPPGGMNGKVQRLVLSFDCSYDMIGARINRSNAKQIRDRDFESSAFSPPLRHESSDTVTQLMKFQALALPKGDTRILILTFHDRSLEPWYWMVRSLPTGLIFETVNSC